MQDVSAVNTAAKNQVAINERASSKSITYITMTEDVENIMPHQQHPPIFQEKPLAIVPITTENA